MGISGCHRRASESTRKSACTGHVKSKAEAGGLLLRYERFKSLHNLGIDRPPRRQRASVRDACRLDELRAMKCSERAEARPRQLTVCNRSAEHQPRCGPPQNMLRLSGDDTVRLDADQPRCKEQRKSERCAGHPDCSHRSERHQLTLLQSVTISPTDAPHVGPAIPLPRSLEAGATGEFP